MAKPEILVSIDGEFTGPTPGDYSMISLGAVAYQYSGEEISRFKVNFEELPYSIRHYGTMRWWDEHPEAWRLARIDPRKPSDAMTEFSKWLTKLPGNPRLMGWPLGIDFMFVYWYYTKYLSEKPPFGIDGIDIKTYAMAKLNLPDMQSVSMKAVQRHLGLSDADLIHEPVDDSVRQAQIFFKLREIA